MSAWEDVSETDDHGETFCLRSGELSILVYSYAWRRTSWVLACDALGVAMKALRASTAEDAKVEAVALLEARCRAFLVALEESRVTR